MARWYDAWDMTVAHTMADSYVRCTSHSTAEPAASSKSAKYGDLLLSYLFQATAVKTCSRC